ncbi:hypothetical protein HC026_11120 [Lactobacillus sp. LC28-10]|uniref:Prophage protein n=1 Tax=Secundilactobacillus angelensis TaxID=2722706 RepID=A0ABX1L2M4_9LACO|nr:DUF6096 family protein [Secundilactobacillus angelensis]MCH5463198.1 DUF6096 family protein [Secundilactobacillus angelensis]NLR19443.1 hypothetical protein [Secundilactobacillus angelensis]
MAVKKTTGTQIQLGHLSLDLKLDGKAILNIEKRLGKSVMTLFMNADGGMQMPPTNEILIVLQGANTKHGVSDADMINAFSEYVDQGNSPMDLFLKLTNLFEDSGFFGNNKANQETDDSEQMTLDAPVADEPADEDKSL